VGESKEKESRMDHIQTWLTVALSSGSLVVSVISIVLSVWATRKYGDLAGTTEMIRHEQQMDARKRLGAVDVLLSELARIKCTLLHNSQPIGEQSTEVRVLKVPITAFETAFLSPDSPLLERVDFHVSELSESVYDYLIAADHINALVDVHLESISVADSNHPAARMGRVAGEQAAKMSTALLDLLPRVEAYLNELHWLLEQEVG
jgi:hypothetical protein